MKWGACKLSVFVFLWFSLIVGGYAQVGIIKGKVSDDQGNPIQDVLVRIENATVGAKYSAKTDKKGNYYHGGVRLQSSYHVIAQKEGYQTEHIEGIKPAFDAFSTDKAGEVNFVLVPGKSIKADFELSDQEKEQMKQQQEEEERRAARIAALKKGNSDGIQYYNQGQYELALESFQKATQQDPEQPGLWANLAMTHGKLGDYQQAVEIYQKAIILAPEDPSLYRGLAGAYSKIQEFDQAKEAYEKSASLAEDIDPSSAAIAYFNMGVDFINSGRTQDAVDALTKAITSDSSYAEAYFQLGLSLLGLGRMEESLEHLKKYVEFDPESPNAAVARELLSQLQ